MKMNLQLVKSEFSIKNKRIDTLAYDKQSKAFIIIEYKRSKNILLSVLVLNILNYKLVYLNRYLHHH